ncbi:MAG TPA: molybdopterin-dependent oxidoreductase [Anaeromyxobacter sp.]|nr:molybdopterin-dependent oxidoreductase [Anaeromyxobacter sp.]
MAHPLTTCTFCGAGCGLHLETQGGRIVGVYPSRSHPASQGRLCVRGWHVHEISSSPDRLRRPLLRRDDGFAEVSWDEALAFLVERLGKVVAERGPEAVALFCSPRCSNEETYLLQKLGRAVLGTPNVDHGAGVYGNNSTDVLARLLGVPAATGSIADLDRSDLILVDGLDLARQLPTVAGRVIRARLRGARLVVVGERSHRVAEHADHFLQVRPGTEARLYAAMAKVVADRGLYDREFLRSRCRDADAFLAAAREVDLLAAAKACGLEPEQLEAAALAYGQARAAAILYSTASPRRPEVVEGLVSLALLTGNVGRTGGGLFPLAEHNNLQGVCDVGMDPDWLPGYRPAASAAARAEVERRWGTALPARPGLGAAEVFSAAEPGRIRALWLSRYDPVGTATGPNVARVLEACDLVVIQHVFRPESARYAHVILPTTAFGEEQVTFTSTERRVQLVAQAVVPPPGVEPAWKQLTLLARALGANWSYPSAARVMDEIADLVPFYAGISHAALARGHGRQWPCTPDRPLGTRTLFAEPADAPGRFQLVPPPARPPEEQGDPAYPLTLVFGHSDHYWNQNVLVQHSETLRREHRFLLLDYPEGFVELNPEDAKSLGVREGERVRVLSAEGAAVTDARITPEVRRGAVFAPFFAAQVQTLVHGYRPEAPALLHVRIEKEVSAP